VNTLGRFLRPLAWALLVLASGRLHRGLGGVTVPFTDESVYAAAFRGSPDDPHDGHLYPRLYAAIGRTGGDDPRVAHRGLRFAASTFSGIALFEVLVRLPGVSASGALVAALLWGENLLNTPPVQHGNVNVLAFALGALALVFALAGRGGRAAPRVLSLVFAAFAAWCRIEYALFLLILVAREAARAARCARGRRLLAGAGVLLVTAMLGIPPVRAKVVEAAGWIDRYLLTGLRQCYSAHAAATHRADGDPMAESDAFFRDFPGDATFRSALCRHPALLARYLISNGATNVALLPRRITAHHSLLASWDYDLSRPRPGDLALRAQSWGLTLVLWAGAAAALLHAVRSGGAGRESLFLTLGLGACALVAVLLLIPTPRYWIACSVVPYWGGAWLASRLGAGGWARGAAIAAAALLFSQPAFPGRVAPHAREEQDRFLAEIAANVRSVSGEAGRPASVGGYWPSAFLAWLPPLPARAVNMWDLPADRFRERLEAGDFDLLVLEPTLERTTVFRAAGARVLGDGGPYRRVAADTLPEIGEVLLLRRR
jgi:hypothetical protein